MQIAAIFDLDDTILDGSSGRLFVRYMQETSAMRGQFRRRDLARAAAEMAGWRLGLSNADRAMQRAARIAAGIETATFWLTVYDWFNEMVVHAVRDEARAAITWHRDQGHIPVICSASSQFSVLPAAEHLGIEHSIYTEWLEADGHLTGELRLPLAYGAGKVFWMEQWAADQNVDLSRSSFYTDHDSDCPLLEAVGQPVAVNPNRKLARIAQERDWHVVDWQSKSPS